MAKRGVVTKQIREIRGVQKPGSEKRATRRTINANHKSKSRSRA